MQGVQELKAKLDAAHKAYKEADRLHAESGGQFGDEWDRVVGTAYHVYCKTFEAYLKGPSVPASTDAAALDVSIAANTL
jgi:hypothetical protein